MAEGKQDVERKSSPKKSSFYKLEGSSISRQRKSCPKCGPGVFMAQHKDRTHCGKCGFSEFKQTS